MQNTREDLGVSPLIATTILLFLVLGILTPILVGVASGLVAPLTKEKVGVSLEMRFWENKDRIALYHSGGDTLNSAFKIYDGTVEWINLEVRLNGIKEDVRIEEDMRTPPKGTLIDNAYYDPVNRWVRLTGDVGNIRGQLEYIWNPGYGFIATFEFFAGSAAPPGADATWLYAYCTTTPTWEGDNAGGYHFVFDEWDDEIQLYWQGRKLASKRKLDMDDNRWHRVVITHYGTRTQIYFRGELMLDYEDIERPKTGTRFGWGARTGGEHNEHRIRNLRVYWGVGHALLNGRYDVGIVNFAPDNEFVFSFCFGRPLSTEDEIAVIFVPTEQKLIEMRIPPFG